jgi:hypothetical protein
MWQGRLFVPCNNVHLMTKKQPMFRLSFLLSVCLLSFAAGAQTPTIKIVETKKRVSIRGLSVVTDEIIWASGTGGNVARSTNGGNSFTWIKVPGYEKMDFRDIEAFDSNTAVIMGITNPAVILKTKDGGQTWRKVFEDTAKGAFLDAMDFDHKTGVGHTIGDPIDELNMYMLMTDNGGDSWVKFPRGRVGNTGWMMLDGEAFFASSGTNIKMQGNHSVFVSGGKSSNLFYAGSKFPLPIMQGKETTGANSLAVFNDNKAVVVGGDFSKDTIGSNNCVLINLLWRDAKFSIPETPPHGYRSCVIYLGRRKLLTCGTSGVDISKDGGKNWKLVAKDGFHVCQKARKGKAVFLAGNEKIAKLVMP